MKKQCHNDSKAAIRLIEATLADWRSLLRIKADKAWLEKYRRLNRNYEKMISSANSMTLAAAVCFMFRFYK